MKEEDKVIESRSQGYSTIFKPYLDMPVWQIRHMKVSQFIESKQIRRVMDIGCAEGTLINRLSRSDKIQLLIGVDIDAEVLTQTVKNVSPQMIQDHLAYFRENPLFVKIYQMDILKQIPKEILSNSHSSEEESESKGGIIARNQQQKVQLVTLIQVIEHFHENQLDQLCGVVFKEINPRFVMMTTPNQEFNIFFQFKEGQMRHPDHKYQWTRKQFVDFCERIESKYDYSFQIFGVGEHISDNKHGFCSQGAYFTRKNKKHSKQIRTSKISHEKPKQEIRYPFWQDNIQRNIKIELSRLIIRKNYEPIEEILKNLHQTKIGKKIKETGIIKIDKQFIRKQVSKLNKYYGIDENQLVYYEKTCSSSSESQNESSNQYGHGHEHGHRHEESMKESKMNFIIKNNKKKENEGSSYCQPSSESY